MNEPTFEKTIFSYSIEDIKRLRTLLECNRGIISHALEIALDEKLFESVPVDKRAVFIVEQCEKANAGEEIGKETKQFRFNITK
jgi:hypothetical protein